MPWFLMATQKLRSVENKSLYARRKTYEESFGDFLKQAKDKPNAGSTIERYENLKDFSDTEGFIWQNDPTKPVPLANSRFMTKCRAGGGTQFQDTLGIILSDIARVATASGINRGVGGSWPLPPDAFMIEYCSEELEFDKKKVGFRSLQFFFYAGKGTHYYQWQMYLVADDTEFDCGDIDAVEVLSDAVWRLTRKNGGKQLVIKAETPGVRYASRQEGVTLHHYVTWLALKAFPGVLDTVPLTTQETEVIRDLATDKNMGLLKDSAASALSDRETRFLVKMAAIPIGDSLEKIVDANYPSVKERSKKLELILFNLKSIRKFGAMAVFDLIVQNGDRFSANHDYKAKEFAFKNFTATARFNNLDFTKDGQPIALDNFDPNDFYIEDPKDTEKLTELNPEFAEIFPWRARSILPYLEEQKLFAKRMMDWIILKTEAKESYPANSKVRQQFEDAFYAGMQEGTLALKKLLEPLRKKAESDPIPFGRTVGLEFVSRISMTATAK